MLEALLLLWITCAVCIVFERRVYRIIIYFGIFSLVTSLCYLLLGAPDVAMAEAGISAFTTVFFIICIERYYGKKGDIATEKRASYRKGKWLTKLVLPLILTGCLFALFLYFIPDVEISSYLKNLYLERFADEVGGQNAVTAIYLVYRVYDTLFEALILVISVVAVAHLSWTEALFVSDGRHSEIENSVMAVFTMRIICPILLLFGAYLIINGHISAGGGFQGGLAVACFFVCRYFIYGIYDMPIKKVIRIEELVFINISIVAILFVFFGTTIYIPQQYTSAFQIIYLIIMNLLIGLKVACGFFILFYRYIAIERVESNAPRIGIGYEELRKGRL